MAKNTLARERKFVSPSHIIGIGASAGGMEAIHDLFDYMPAIRDFLLLLSSISPRTIKA